MITNFSDVVIGSVATIIIFMVIVVAIKIFRKTKASEESIFNVINQYKVELIEIGQLCINMVSEDRDSMTELEYNKRILSMTADYFRIFLTRETDLPSFIIDNITGAHIMEILDYIKITGDNANDIDSIDDTVTTEDRDEISLESDNLYQHIDLNKYDTELGTEPVTLEDEGKVDITSEITNIMDDDFIIK